MRGKRLYYTVQTVVHKDRTVSMESYRVSQEHERRALRNAYRYTRDMGALLINEVRCDTATMHRLMALGPAVTADNKVLGQKYRDAEQAAHEKARGKLGLERDAIVERVDDACLHYRQAVRRGEDEESAWAAFQSACSEAITDWLDGG